MITGFSKRMSKVFKFMNEETIRLGDTSSGVEHLFLAILREGSGSAVQVLKRLGIVVKDIKIIIEGALKKQEKYIQKKNTTLNLTKQTERILRKSILERKNLEEEEIKTVHVLLAILLDKNNIVSSALRHMKIDYDTVLEEYLNTVSYTHLRAHET